MRKAMVEAALPEEAARVLDNFFDGTATFMINRA